MTRKEQKAVTRQTLKAAAMTCFSRLGYDDASIGAITREAGVAHGTFYVHFPSKDAVMDELLAEFNAGFVDRMAGLVGELSTASTGDILGQGAGIFLDYWQERRDFIEAYAQRVAGSIGLAALKDGLSSDLVKIAAGWIRMIAAKRKIEIKTPELIAQALAVLWFRIGLQYLFSEDVSRQRATELLQKMTLGALAQLIPGLDAPPTANSKSQGQE